MHFEDGRQVRFWLRGDPLTVQLRDGIWHMAWRDRTASHARIDEAAATLLGQSTGSTVPLIVRLLRAAPESQLD